MRKIYLVSLLSASLLSACGGGGGGYGFGPVPTPVDPKPVFGAQISFGDSLSDVGTYAVGTVKELGGGKFTVNGDNTAINPALTGQNWTEVMASSLNLPSPCAAQTGLEGDAASGFAVPVTNHAGCFGYAQGGARVTHPVGPNNKATASALGALTVPVVTQIANHLAVSGGEFKPDDMVLVMAGGNDMLFQLGGLTAAATAAGSQAYVGRLATLLAADASFPAAAAQVIGQAMATEAANPGSTNESVTGAGIAAAAAAGSAAAQVPGMYGPMVADAQTAGGAAGEAYAADHGPALVPEMAKAGAELAALVKDQILAKGAAYVTVNNLPDVASTPAGRTKPEAVQALMQAMAQAFNDALGSGLSGEARVLLVDVHALSADTAVNPDAYGLSNVTDMACDISLAKNLLGSSLVCNASNLNTGDVSHYAYADDVHPTPYFYGLLAKHVAEKMTARGWL